MPRNWKTTKLKTNEKKLAMIVLDLVSRVYCAFINRNLWFGASAVYFLKPWDRQ